MLEVKLNHAEAGDLHERVAAQIRRAIADGEATPGERLPPAKDLAAVIGVNTNTVLRALRSLREEGLLDFRRGRGITVAGTAERGAVVDRVHELVRFAGVHGYDREELVRIIRTSAG
jgi:GntR family transcriptional regulator